MKIKIIKQKAVKQEHLSKSLTKCNIIYARLFEKIIYAKSCKHIKICKE